MPMLELRNLTQQILQLHSDCTYSSIHRLQVLSSQLLRRRRMYILLHTQASHLHLVWVGSLSYTSTTADVLSTARIPADQVVKSSITLLTYLVRKHPRLRLEGVRRPLWLLTRAAMPLPMLNLRRWMSITSLMAGKHPIRIPPPLETRGNSRSPRIHTHAKPKECAVQYRMIHTTVAALVQALYLPHPPLMPAVHVHLITTILQEGCKLPQGLPATIVHLTLIPGNRAGMVQRAIEMLIGIVVSGSVGIRAGGGVDHRIPRDHLRLLGP